MTDKSPDVEEDCLLRERIRNKRYTLVKGVKIGLSYDHSRVSMMQWLALLRGTDHSRLGGAFYFPENFAGPDILFVLKPQGDTDSKEMILCVIQVSLISVLREDKMTLDSSTILAENRRLVEST